VSAFLISQLLAAVAFLFGIASFQFKARKAVLLCIFFCAIFNSFHFFTLERFGVGTLILVMSLRFLVAAFWPSQRGMLVFIVLAIISFSFSYEYPVSLLGLAATLLGTVGSFKKSDRDVRLYLMAASALWVVHNLFVGTPVAVLMEASFMLSNFIAWKRYYPTK